MHTSWAQITEENYKSTRLVLRLHRSYCCQFREHVWGTYQSSLINVQQWLWL